MANVIIRSWIDAPEFADVPTFMKKLAWQLGLNIEIEVDKGFFRETVRFKIEGDEAKVKQFARTFDKAIEEWQAG